MKKILTFFAAAMMLCASVHAQATSGSCGANATWEYEGTTLTISGTGEMADYNYGETPWKDYATTLKYVDIDLGITSVGNNAFADFDALTSVTFPPEGFVRIGEYAFSGCTSLKYPSLPKALTSLGTGAFSGSGIKGINIPRGVKRIGDYAFEGCFNLEGVSIYDGVEEIGDYAFDGSGLPSVVIPNTVTSIGEGAFMYNMALASVFIGEKVTSIGTTAFQGCGALTKVGCVAAAKPTLGEAVFTQDDGTTLLDIEAFYVADPEEFAGWGGFDAAKFKTTFVGEWENDAPALGSGTWSFDVPTGTLTINGTGIIDFNTPWNNEPVINPTMSIDNEHPGFWAGVKKCVIGEGITSLEGMVCGMQINCAEVILPNTLKTITNSALEECAFTSITLPEGLETIDMYAFFGSKLTSVTIPSTVTKLGYSVFLYNEDLATVTVLATNPPALETELPFNECDALTAIYVPAASVDVYKTEWADYAALIQEYIPPTTTFTYTASEKLDVFNSNARFIGATAVLSHEFAASVGTVVYEGTVTAIQDHTFYYSSATQEKMTGITIPASVQKIGEWAFNECVALASVTFEGTSQLTTIESNAFGKCTALKTITLPESLTTLGNTVEVSGNIWENGAVFDGAGLTSLEIPKNLTTIYGGAHLADCPLTSLTVNAANTKFDSREGCNAVVETATDKIVMGCWKTTVPDGIKAIGFESFFGESQEFSLNLPESVTAIESRAFHFATGLRTIRIPSGVTTIDEETFMLAEGVTDVYCYAAPTMTWEGLDFAFKMGDPDAVKFHVKEADLTTWQTNFPDANVTFVGDLDKTTSVDSQQAKIQNQKVIRGGQLLIEKDGKIYNAVGQEVK